MILQDAPGPALPAVAMIPARPGDQDLREIMTGPPPRPGVLDELDPPPDRHGNLTVAGWRHVHDGGLLVPQYPGSNRAEAHLAAPIPPDLRTGQASAPGPDPCEDRRVGGGISAAAPHRSGRESLDSSGSCRPVIRACTAGPSARTGQVPVPGPLAAILAHVCRYVPAACTSTSPSASDGDRRACRAGSPCSGRTR